MTLPEVEPARGPRRRHADGRRRPSVRAVLAPWLVVLLALGAVLLVSPPDSAMPTARVTATDRLVERTVLACPDLAAADRDPASVRLGLAPSSAGLRLPDTGPVRQGPVTSTGPQVDLARGRVVRMTAEGMPAVDASGGAAAGLFGFRTDRARGRTMAIASCVAPRSRWWFTGAGAGLDHASTLVLANIDPGPAVLDIEVLGGDGRVETVGTQGITMAGHSVRRIALSRLAPQTDELALGVRTQRGRVVAAVGDSFSVRPTRQPGREWLAATDLPTRRLRLAGMPVTPHSRTLLVANPSDREAVVEVRVAGRSGSFAPTGLDAITVGPEAIEPVDLAGVLPKEAVALRLLSRVPVVASVRSVDAGDETYATPVVPLVGPAVAPLVKGVHASVQLTAGAAEASATVTAYDRTGQRVDTATLPIPATGTRAWSPKGGGAYVVVRPPAGGRGTVFGAVTYRGSGVAAVPLVALPIHVERPSVRPALR